MSVPSGEMAMAGLSALSPGSAAFTGADHVTPPSADDLITACSSLTAPSGQATTIVLVASRPSGAPLAIAKLGKLSVRVPAKPSNTTRPEAGSNAPTSCTLAITFGLL